MLICTVQSLFQMQIIISGLKCDKVVDFLKSGHIYGCSTFIFQKLGKIIRFSGHISTFRKNFRADLLNFSHCLATLW